MSLVVVLIGRQSHDVIGRLSVKRRCNITNVTTNHTMTFENCISYSGTSINEPLCNEVLGVANNILQPG